jgi:hypothetical protein
MSLAQGRFTKESKAGAVGRLELGASVVEVARASEANPNVLYRWRSEQRPSSFVGLAGGVGGEIIRLSRVCRIKQGPSKWGLSGHKTPSPFRARGVLKKEVCVRWPRRLPSVGNPTGL